ncbi:MAG: hypothetical protein ACK559_40620, partial [bacterium]
MLSGVWLIGGLLAGRDDGVAQASATAGDCTRGMLRVASVSSVLRSAVAWVTRTSSPRPWGWGWGR